MATAAGRQESGGAPSAGADATVPIPRTGPLLVLVCRNNAEDLVEGMGRGKANQPTLDGGGTFLMGQVHLLREKHTRNRVEKPSPSDTSHAVAVVIAAICIR